MNLILSDNMKSEFMKYALKRKSNCELNYKPMKYLTENILDNTFTFFLNHKLTIEDNAKSYWYQGNVKIIECYGYSGFASGFRDDEEGMKFNLFHEIWCKSEWIARSVKENYSQTVKSTIGTKAYNEIIQ